MKMLKSGKTPTHQSNGSHRTPRFDTDRYESKALNSKTQRSVGSSELRNSGSFASFLIL